MCATKGIYFRLNQCCYLVTWLRTLRQNRLLLIETRSLFRLTIQRKGHDTWHTQAYKIDSRIVGWVGGDMPFCDAEVPFCNLIISFCNSIMSFCSSAMLCHFIIQCVMLLYHSILPFYHFVCHYIILLCHFAIQSCCSIIPFYHYIIPFCSSSAYWQNGIMV